GLCKELVRLCARFLWGSTDTHTKIHWSSWNRLCAPKEEGGIGFRDFQAFYQAMLAKHCWRIITNPDSLAARVLKSKYFHDSFFLQAGVGRQPSFIWRSILWGREVINRGSR
ncbi:hypothetical protein Dsin_000596, partial [Dipteronia sinensis]